MPVGMSHALGWVPDTLVVRGVSPWCDVKSFGAVGDGSTTDTTAVQAALNGGANTIFFPPGNYKCGGLTIPSTVHHIIGFNGATLTQAAAGASLLVTTDHLVLTVDGLLFVGVSGDFNTSPNIALDYWTSGSTTVGNSTRLTVRNCYFTGWRQYGIRAGWVKGLEITNCQFDLCSNAISIIESHDVRIHHNRIVSSQATSTDTRAISISTNNTTPSDHNRRIVVDHNTIDNWVNGEAIMCHDGIGVVIDHNILTDVLTGIVCTIAGGTQAMQEVEITDNVYIGTSTAGATWTANMGIQIGGIAGGTDAIDCRITGNTIVHANYILQNSAHGAIYSEGDTNNLDVSGNQIDDCQGNGIEFVANSATHTRLKIRDNDIRNIVSIAGSQRCIHIGNNTYDGIILGNSFDDCISGIVVNTANAPNLYLIRNHFGANCTNTVTLQAGAIVTDISRTTTAAGTVMTSRFQEAEGASIAAANNLVLGADGNCFHITGATQINLIASTNWQGGGFVTLIFDSTPTVKHNQAASGANKPILLSGAADFSATANDTLTLRYDSTNSSWYEMCRTVI